MRRLLSRELIIVVGLVAALALATGCGKSKSSSSNTTSTQVAAPLAQSKVVLYGALVYGAFHHYISTPQNTGALAVGASGGTRARSTSAAAALFMARELGQMKTATLSNDKFRPISVKIDNLVPRLGLLINKLRTGKAVAADVHTTSGALDSIVSAAKNAGATIPLDKIPAIPGA